jgi:hypothetical protein
VLFSSDDECFSPRTTSAFLPGRSALFSPNDARTYQRIDSRKNTIDRVFFRCAIQATDCTFTGCREKSIAASHAPGSDSRRRMAQMRSPAAMCSRRFVT